jgi:hypothetical protein
MEKLTYLLESLAVNPLFWAGLILCGLALVWG